MFAGTALSVRLFVCAGLSLFIIYGPYLYVVVCVIYAYNLTVVELKTHTAQSYVTVFLVPVKRCVILNEAA